MIKSPSESTFDGLPEGQWRYVGGEDNGLYSIAMTEEARNGSGNILPMKTTIYAVGNRGAWMGDLLLFWQQFKRI